MKKKIRSFLDFMASRPYIKSKKKISSLDELEDDPHEFWKNDPDKRQFVWDMSNDKSDDEKEQTNIPEKKPKDLDSFYELDDDERQSVPYLDDESYDEEDQTNEPEKDQEQSDYSYIHPETSPEDRKKDYLNLRKQIKVTKKKPISTIDYADIKTQMNNLRKSEMGPNSYVGRSQEHLERAVLSFYTSHNWKKPEKKIISVENAGEYDYTLKKSEAFQKVRIGIMVPSDTKMNYNTRFESFYIIVKKKNYEIQLGGDGNSFKKMILEDSHVRGELNDLIKAIQDEIIVSS